MTTTDPGTPALPLRRIQPIGSAAAVTCYLKTQWPRIGGPALRALPDTAFTDPVFLARYQPGILTFPYLAACGPSADDPLPSSGLKNVADRLQMPIYKLSSTELADPRRRLKVLDRDRYASHVLTPAGYVQESGFKTWTFQQFLPQREPLPGSPVGLDGRLFALRRPHDMTKRVFEKLLHRHLRNASLNSFLLTPAGRAHCAILGLVPEEEQRWTNYRFARTPRIDKAEELYIFRPSGEDSDRFLTIIERIIHDWVMCQDRRLPRAWHDHSQYSRRGQ